MTILEANQFLPEKGNGSLDAFSRVLLKHGSLGRNPEEMFRLHPQEKVAQAVSDCFTAGVAFLANRVQDEQLQMIGTEAWQAVNQRKAVAAMTTNMATAAIALGVSPVDALYFVGANEQSHVLLLGRQNGPPTHDIGFILLPPELMVRAQENSGSTLAEIAFLCTKVRDLSQGRLHLDNRSTLNARANAVEAHFLLYALQKQPDLQLTDLNRNLLEMFPEGIKSLPEGVWYKDSTV